MTESMAESSNRDENSIDASNNTYSVSQQQINFPSQKVKRTSLQPNIMKHPNKSPRFEPNKNTNQTKPNP